MLSADQRPQRAEVATVEREHGIRAVFGCCDDGSRVGQVEVEVRVAPANLQRDTEALRRHAGDGDAP